jgi:PPM family protein phosphatase
MSVQAEPGATTSPRPPSTNASTSPTTAAGRRLGVRSHGLTDQGRLRTSNQDQFLIAELAKSMHIAQSSLAQPRTQYGEERGHLLVVADGMGGHAGGEQASALAVVSIEDFALNTLKWFFHLEEGEGQNVVADLQTAMRDADERVFQEAASHPELRGMGTTVTMAYILGATLFVIHVGDSRGYMLRDGKLYRLTNDHTVAQDLVNQGVLEPEVAAHHPYSHIITNAVGGTTHGLQVEVLKLEIAPGDRLLLCSDGLTDMVTDEGIAAALRDEPDPAAACQRLVSEANAAGGKDNITVVISHIAAAPGASAA